MVASLHADFTGSRSDRTAPLRARTPSGYRCVYFHKQNAYGVPVYVGRVKLNGVLMRVPGSRSTEPWRVALKVVDWYEQRFGPDWQRALRGRHLPTAAARYSPARCGWLARVWVEGRPMEVTVLKRRRWRGDVWRCTDQLAVFATERAALAGADVWARRRFGLFAEVVRWRHAEAEPSQSRAA